MFHKISSILPKSLLKNKIAPQVGATLLLLEVQFYIKEILGEKLETEAHPLYLKDSVITIKTSSPSIMSELKLYESGMIERLREKFPQSPIKGVRFLVT